MLDIEQSISGFLKQKKNDYYINNLNVFRDFLSWKKVSNDVAKEFLRGATTETIIESLDFYIRENSLTSEDTAQRYISCIKEYFLYTFHTKEIENKELAAEMAYTRYSPMSFTYKVNEFITNDNRLKKSKEFDLLTDDEINKLIKYCNKTLDDPEIMIKAVKHQRYFNKARSSLIIKLMLLTGIKYEFVPDIRTSDLNLRYNYIVINGFKIHLPDNLRDQFEVYENIICKLKSRDDKREYLFLEFDKSKLSKITSITGSFMKEAIGRMDLNGLIKHTIIEMIKNETNEYIIKTFTGVGEKIYNQCQDKVLEMKVNGYLDSKIRSLGIYDIL